MYTLHNQIIDFKSKKSIPLFATLVAFSLLHMPEAYAQGLPIPIGPVSTLRDPLVPGASSQMPGVTAPLGFAPAPGSGPSSVNQTQGMTGEAPTYVPSIPAIPSNSINSPFSGIGLPIPSSALGAPGTWGPALYGLVPNSPSTPGANPAPYGLKGLGNPALPTQVMPGTGVVGGGLPGTGGYYSSIPKLRALRTQDMYGGTVQYERRGRQSVLGTGAPGGGGFNPLNIGVPGNAGRGLQDEITQHGPLAGWGLINGIPTGVGYNKGVAGSNSDLYNKSFDLGGGMRMRAGGIVTSTGKTIQDNNGRNVLYGNATPSLGSTLSTEFGQGSPLAYGTVGRVPNRSTDFGFPLTPQTGLNAHPWEPMHTLPQNAIETNY